MAAPARLSPAANLLRNSKLFALPSAIPLPPSKPTAEPVAGSETQTTIYPTRAAIVTPHATLLRGDWGLKRALPLKSTTNTSTPSIRLNKDIDSADHVADFESAADHVQTYAKWQDVPIMMTHRPKWVADPNIARYDGRTPSVFHPDLDNGVLERPELDNIHNTDQGIPPHLQKSLEQLKSDREAAAQASGQPLPRTIQAPKSGKLGVKRWRYGGPWLAGMSEIEFEAYLKHLSTERIASFREHLASKIREIKESRVTVKADQQKQNSIEVTDKEITDAVRKLRQDPQAFGPEIAQFLDLPEGPMKPSMVYNPTRDWTYGRQTIASVYYSIVGPPRTHPSAGFSYVQTSSFSHNSPFYGPRKPMYSMPARVLRDRRPSEKEYQKTEVQDIGVGGLLARVDNPFTGLKAGEQWMPKKGGMKVVVRPTQLSVQQNGALELGIEKLNYRSLTPQNVPYDPQERSKHRAEMAKNEMPTGLKTLPDLDQSPMKYRKAEEVSMTSRDEVDEVFNGIRRMPMR